MPTGSTRRRPRAPAAGQSGFTYLLLLFVLAIAAAGTGELARSLAQAAQQERETELLFRAQAIRHALADWQAATPPGRSDRLPTELSALLLDTRGPVPRRHLRRVYACPWSGVPDWRLLRDERGGIYGLASRSRTPALRRTRLGEGVRVAAADADRPTVAEWIFEVPRQPAQAPRTGGGAVR